MSLKYLATCLLFTLLATTVKAATYYVSPSGDDANSGTSKEQAWATIAKVNRSLFLPGDSILFQGGATFSGSLFFGNTTKGTAEQPLLIGSFGTGRAIINSGSSYGFKAYNTAGFRLERLVFQGAGRTNNNAPGIEFYMDLANTRLPYISLDSLDVSGYHDAGISIGSWMGASGFDDISITRSGVHDNGDAGISSYAEARLGHKNMYVGYNKVYNNSGLPEKTNLHSGNGIVLGGVDGALIEYCEAYNNGWLNAWKDGGPVGIWGWHCNNLVIQYNESHHNKTGTGKDGGGFDIDGGCTNCSMQYNYSHDNEGAGYLVAQYYYAPAMQGIVVRYNISENDARKNGYGAIHLWSSGSNGGIQDAEIYNNTIYLTPAAHGTPRGIYVQSGGVKNVRIYNNIIQTTGGLEQLYIDVLTDLRFEGNNYWPSGSSFKIKWGSTYYTTLDSWMAATGQEQRNGLVVGTQLDPGLTDPGKGVNFTEPGTLYQLDGYQLKAGSALVGKGLNLAELGVNTGTVDFWGNNIEKRSAYCIGAHQLTDNTNVCLSGGLIPLSFGQGTGGTYSGKGVDQGQYFNPELTGQGKHGIRYAYTDAQGQTHWDTHTFTVANAASTFWKGVGAASNDWFDSQNWSACVPTAAIDVQIPLPENTATGEGDHLQPTIKAGKYATARSLTLPGKLTVENGATLEINDSLSGAGLAADSGSMLIFKSAHTQRIPAAAYSTLLLQGAGSKVLGGDVSVNQQLVLEGKLFLGDYALVMKAGSEIVNPTAAAYVVTDATGSLTFEQIGEGGKEVFPIGTATTYTPAIIENAGVKDNYSIRVEEGVWENSTPDSPSMKGMVNRTWHVEEKTPGGSDVTLSLQWNEEDEMGDFDRLSSYVTHYENGKWSKPAEGVVGTASLVGAEGSLIKSMGNITSFSPFSVGSDNTSLPVLFTFFKLERQNRDVQLHWETAGEKNNSGFEVEVSTDGKHYRTLGFVASSSPNSNQPLEYRFLDDEPGKYGTRYYRLKQIDFDGTISYSPIQSIAFEGGEVDMTLFPNPFIDNIRLEINASEGGVLQLQISDGLGRTVKAKQINLQKGVNRISLSLEEELPAGLYLLHGRLHGAVWQQKILKK